MKTTTERALTAIHNEYQKTLADILIKNAARAHIAGDIKASKLLDIGISFDLIQEEALAYSKDYGKLLYREGASIIQGKKIPWLKDHTGRTRERVFKTIRDGLKEGKPVSEIGGKKIGKGTIAYDLKQIMGMEDRSVVSIARTECYSSDTEVLTINGWKCFSNIEKNDEIATLNNRGELEYQYPSEIINYFYSGKMYHFKSTRMIDLCVTPEHNLYIADNINQRDQCLSYTKYKLKTAEECFGKRYRLKRNAIWHGIEQKEFLLPPSSGKGIENIINPIPMDLWLEFLGYYISEGHSHISGKNYEVNISQSPLIESWDKFEKIKICFNKLPFKSKFNNNHSFRIYSKQLAEHLKTTYGSVAIEKHIPKEIKCLSTRQLNILIDALILGDGHISKGRKTERRSYTTISKNLADDILELLLKTNQSGNIGIVDARGEKAPNGITRHIKYIIGINTMQLYPYVNLSSSKQCKDEWIDYEGLVGCVTVPNGIIYVRRNGKPLWCGNCARISNQGTLTRYDRNDVTEVDVLDDEGPNSCDVCREINGQRWTLTYARTHELEHPNCVRAFTPVIKRR